MSDRALLSQSVTAESVGRPVLVEPAAPKPAENWLSPCENLPNPRQEQGTYQMSLSILRSSKLLMLMKMMNLLLLLLKVLAGTATG